MDELTKRNFEALSQGLKMLRDDLDNVKEENKKKDAIISNLNNDIMLLKQQNAILFGKIAGSGSTAH